MYNTTFIEKESFQKEDLLCIFVPCHFFQMKRAFQNEMALTFVDFRR